MPSPYLFPMMSSDELLPRLLYLLSTIGGGGDDFYPAIHTGAQENCCLAGKSAYLRLNAASLEALLPHECPERPWKKTFLVIAESLIAKPYDLSYPESP